VKVWSVCVGEGWKSIVDEAVQQLTGAGATITQVKEKFGGLRIYYNAPSDEIYEYCAPIVRRAALYADITCEDCGVPGKNVNVDGWYRTLCPECFKLRLKDREDWLKV